MINLISHAEANAETRKGCDLALAITVEPVVDPPGVGVMWRALEAETDGGFFLSWAWIGPWLTELTLGGGSAALIVAGRGDRVVGLACLGRRTVRRHRVLPVRTLFLNEAGDPARDVITIEYNDVLAWRGQEAEVRRACIEALLVRRD